MYRPAIYDWDLVCWGGALVFRVLDFGDPGWIPAYFCSYEADTCTLLTAQEITIRPVLPVS